MQASERLQLIAEYWKRKHRHKLSCVCRERVQKQLKHDQDRNVRQNKDICCHRMRKQSEFCCEKSVKVACCCSSNIDVGGPSIDLLARRSLTLPSESLIEANKWTSLSSRRRTQASRSSLIETDATIRRRRKSESKQSGGLFVNKIGTTSEKQMSISQDATQQDSTNLVGMQTNAKTPTRSFFLEFKNRDHSMGDFRIHSRACKKLLKCSRGEKIAILAKAIILLLVQQSSLSWLFIPFELVPLTRVAAFNQEQSGQLQQGGAQLQNNIAGDPRPTIYSGQISFGLLLSAHSSMGAEIVGSASHQIQTIFALEDQKVLSRANLDNQTSSSELISEITFKNKRQQMDERLSDDNRDLESGQDELNWSRKRRRRRQIFHSSLSARSKQAQQASSKSTSPTQHCSQVNPNALYAGMGAIWASHQANLVADSHFTMGTYVYDSCNDADVAQRQSVRIVSNLNAFQQTTCESPRGSPISLTIAHGDDQVKAIHLLTSFRVPVISTKEHFAQEAYGELNNLQRKYLFSSAPSSRHLALGALRFARRVAAKSASSPKLPNRLNKSSSRNGLVVMSRDLPQAFIAYLSEIAPQLVNYELLASKLPIDQISSIQRLEAIFMKSQAFNKRFESQTTSESRLITHQTEIGPRNKRWDVTESPDGASDAANSQDTTGDETSQPKMLSPTILMFITPAEAIDLITRLRNNMAEVSKYYSLIIVTREDITPALKTIFQRGGSSLCSGKAFYTISPKPDDMSEFSRYFRDTVHIEGETSDHPLICEFAKHAASSRIATDYDDVAAEPVVKAVWAAAAAFKQVHQRECGSLVASASSSPALNANNFYKSPSTTSSSISNAHSSSDLSQAKLAAGDLSQQQQQQQIRSLKSRQSSSGPTSQKSAHSECMMKMSKSMSQLVQRALKKINVTINSTGLQSLDGFQVSFDELNELNSNKFSIRHINKECEIEEIGQYTGLKGSQLHLDNAAILKSLESTLPDAWPVTLAPSTQTVTSTTTTSTPPQDSTQSTSSAVDNNSASGQDNSDNSSTNPSWLGEQPAGTSMATSRRKKPSNHNQHYYKRDQVNQQDQSPSDQSTDEEAGSGNADSSIESTHFRHKTSKRSRAPGNHEQVLRAKEKNRAKPAPIQASTRPSSTSGNHIGLTDAQPEHEADSSVTTTLTNSLPATTSKPMRKLMPYPSSTEGANLKDWIPREQTSMHLTTTQATHYDHSTLPESGGNTDLEIPAKLNSRPAKSNMLANNLSNNLLATTTPMNQANTLSPEQASAGQFVTMESAITQEQDRNFHLQQEAKFTMLRANSTQNRANNSTVKSTWPSQKLASQATLQHETNLDTSATTVSSVIMKPFGRQGFSFDLGEMSEQNQNNDNQMPADRDQQYNSMAQNQFKSPFKNVHFSPVALSSEAPALPTTTTPTYPQLSVASAQNDEGNRLGHSQSQKLNRFKLRTHLSRIYNSWFGLAILIANILGAIMTLYVLTFLLMKNCDGSLNRENQNVRSMHLLAIIVVFFGSTLFIVSPTPGLCLLRASWHNFGLVLLFGCLLSQTMQTRSLRTLGLGGRPNRLNQFLNLLFLVGVQVSFELQRWKYESANYLNFVNQYFGSPDNDHKKLMILGNAIENQFNPLDSFNDLVTPISIQVSEKYQNLLQDYCIQQTDDFMQSQIYLCIIVILAILFSFLTRKHSNYGANHQASQRGVSSLLALTNRTLKSRFLTGGGRKLQGSSGGHDQMLAAATAAASLTSGKLVASEHEANLNLSSLPSSHHHQQQQQQQQHQLEPPSSIYRADSTIGVHQINANSILSSFSGLDNQMVFLVSVLNGSIYACSILLHIYGQNNGPSRDLISSVTMVLIAFVTLIGVFLPVLNQIHRFDKGANRHMISTHHHKQISSTNSTSSSSIGRGIVRDRGFNGKMSFIGDKQRTSHRKHTTNNLSSKPFTMFPEFSPTGLKRPTSMASLSGGESATGSGSRKPFAETKESRRKMGFVLANLTLDQEANSVDSHYDQNQFNQLRPMGFYDPDVRDALAAQFRDSSMISMKLNETLLKDDQQQQHHQQQQQQQQSSILADLQFDQANNNNRRHHQTQVKSVHRLSKASGNSANEKRLIMLDVDPCCPKHGNVTRQSQHHNCHNKITH